MRADSSSKQTSVGVRAARGAAVIAIAFTGALAGAAFANAQRAGSLDHVVIGSGPHAVYVGVEGRFGGDPAPGETAESYRARTGRELPGLSSAVIVDAPWWYGRAPLVGGDPASGETEDSYFARTGDHIASRFGAAVNTPTQNPDAQSGGDPVPGETDESYYTRTGDHTGG